MAGKYAELITAVLGGQVVEVSAIDNSIESVRATIYRELRAAQTEEKLLGVQHYNKLQLSITMQGSVARVRLKPKPQVTFTIIEGSE